MMVQDLPYQDWLIEPVYDPANSGNGDEQVRRCSFSLQLGLTCLDLVIMITTFSFFWSLFKSPPST